MKILITEDDPMKKIYDSYISKMFGKLEKYIPTDSEDRGDIYWKNKNDKLILLLSDDVWHIPYDYRKEFSNFFGVSLYSSNGYFFTWCKKHIENTGVNLISTTGLPALIKDHS